MRKLSVVETKRKFLNSRGKRFNRESSDNKKKKVFFSKKIFRFEIEIVYRNRGRDIVEEEILLREKKGKR